MIKHRVVVHVRDSDGKGATVCRAADRWLPGWLVKLLFGNYRQVYLLDPGKTIDSVEVEETKIEKRKNQEETL